MVDEVNSQLQEAKIDVIDNSSISRNHRKKVS